MLLLLSGEGASDIGATIPGRDGQPTFVPGPMAHLIDMLLAPIFGYSLLEVGAVHHLSRVKLAGMAKEGHARPRMLLPGVKRPAGYAGDFKQALAFGLFAVELKSREGRPVLGVLFRDSDGTNSSPDTRWEELIAAFKSGFAAARFRQGVLMLPKPKQESWMLCALKHDPYVNCAALEDEPGNDKSPNSLKKQLSVAVGEQLTADLLSQLMEGIDLSKIDMPSFNAFRDDLIGAANECL